MTDPEACKNGRRDEAKPAANAFGSKKGEDAISVLLFFPAAYLLRHYWESPFAFLGLLGVWLFINVYFRLVPPVSNLEHR
jgi:hypothetical protein